MRIRILASLVAIVAVYSEKGIAAAHIASRGTASEVLWATHILLLRTDSAEMGERVRPAHGPEYRDATLRLVIQDVLKGHVRQPIGKTFTHATRVYYGWGGGGVPGLWSNLDPLLRGDKRWLVFCSGDGIDDATVLLTDDQCLPLVPYESAYASSVADTREVLRLQRIGATDEKILAEAWSQRTPRGSIFVGYVWARLGSRLMKSPVVFSTLTAIIEDPDVARRQTILPGSYFDYVAGAIRDARHQQTAGVREREVRFTRTMLIILCMPDFDSSRDNLMNWLAWGPLGLDKAMPNLTSAEVFRGDASFRAQVTTVVESMRQQPWQPALLRWLQKN